MAKSNYRCFLYKQIDGKTVTHICSGVDGDELTRVVDDAIAEGWHTTFADFIDGVVDITEEKAEQLKDICSIAAADANILANAERIKDIDRLKESYARITGREMDSRCKSIKGVRNAIKKALEGESNVN